MALIIPKNNAEEKTLDATLKIYYDANDWVTNEVLIDKLSTALDNLGIEEEKKEPQSYTKKTQVLAYYGFIVWEEETNAQSRRKITELGKRFFQAKSSGDSSRIIETLIESLNKCTFGRNVTGCNSDSDLEPPNIFLKSALLLDGLNLNEFAYILQKMEFDNAELADAIFDVSLHRKMGQPVFPNAQAAKWKDPKPILALGNWGLFSVEKKDGLNRYYLNKYVIENYSKELMALRTKNTETLRFVMKDNDDNFNEAPEGLQVIYYGAPGTGKSHEINTVTKGKQVIRTTFHPDSDYSTFVGCYKPTMENADVRVVPVVVDNGISLEQNNGTYKEKRISYKFIMQAFLKAYLGAWKKYTEANDSEVEPQYLIIEEINRGNCAQIFGDLFQLLDRGDNGFSEYPIEADSDLQQGIEFAFKEHKDYKLENEINADGAIKDYTSNYNATLSEDIQHGRVLLLPPNLYIWATMNTSDQSLFPIDSAFKRRWDWVYKKIRKGKDENGNELNWNIVLKDIDGNIEKINDKESLLWWAFIEKINEIIASMTSSADKQLGFFFCKADKNNVINEKTFVAKVLFYLWNDVFKDYGFEDASLFQYKDEKGENVDLTFPDFYDEDGENVNTKRVADFLQNVMNWKKKNEENN